jgi:hypothetical protein
MASGRMNFHDDLTPMQARVLFHSERLFRGVGASRLTERARAMWIAECSRRGLDVTDVHSWTDGDCQRSLDSLTMFCQTVGVHRFRPSAIL